MTRREPRAGDTVADGRASRDEVRRSKAAFRSDRCEVRTDGARLEVSFSGLVMGSFSGSLRFTVYRGTNRLRQEAVAVTHEPSVAYIYQGGLKGLSSDSLTQVAWRDGRGRPQQEDASGGEAGKAVVLRARNRLAVAGGKDGVPPGSSCTEAASCS